MLDRTSIIAGTSTTARRTRMNAAWLVRLRWVAASGQLVTIAVAVAMGVALPLLELLAIVGVTVATNAMFHWWIRRGESLENEHPDGETILAAVMLLDLSSLTGLLAFTGGLSNPFALFYLVNVAARRHVAVRFLELDANRSGRRLLRFVVQMASRAAGLAATSPDWCCRRAKPCLVRSSGRVADLFGRDRLLSDASHA
ncbi:MAG: hypothetical protein R3C99_07090 [Pirellulaceae bacterium]